MLTTLKSVTVQITNCGKFLKRREYQTTLLASCKTCMQVKKKDRIRHKQWSGPKLGKEYIKEIRHPAYLISMQSTSWEMLG